MTWNIYLIILKCLHILKKREFKSLVDLPKDIDFSKIPEIGDDVFPLLKELPMVITMSNVTKIGARALVDL